MPHRQHVPLLPSQPQPFCSPSPTSTGRLRFRRSRRTLLSHTRSSLLNVQLWILLIWRHRIEISTSNPFPPFIQQFSTLSEFCPMTILRFGQSSHPTWPSSHSFHFSTSRFFFVQSHNRLSIVSLDELILDFCYDESTRHICPLGHNLFSLTLPISYDL